MSYGKLNTFIEIITMEPSKDAEGFVSSSRTPLCSTGDESPLSAHSVAPPLPTKSATLRGPLYIGDTVLASIRAYKEDRHGNTSWANRAAFSSATALFRFRRIPGFDVVPSLYLMCTDGQYRVLSVEDVKGRGMYMEVLAEKIEPAGR